jgi:hypothetical protein
MCGAKFVQKMHESDDFFLYIAVLFSTIRRLFKTHTFPADFSGYQ